MLQLVIIGVELVESETSATAGKTPQIIIYGNDYYTPDGTCVWDYILVTDLAEAHILALKLLSEFDRSETFNFGTGNGYSLKDIIRMTESIIGQSIPLVNGTTTARGPSGAFCLNRKNGKLAGLESELQRFGNYYPNSLAMLQ